MAVYVDQFRTRMGRMLMSHLLADSVVELHARADQIGLRREWFQGRRRAIALGAVEIGRRETARLIRQWRQSQ